LGVPAMRTVHLGLQRMLRDRQPGTVHGA